MQPTDTNIIDSLEEERNRQQLRKVTEPVRTARISMYLMFTYLFSYSIYFFVTLYEYLSEQLIYSSVRTIGPSLIYLAFILASYRSPLIVYAIMALLTSISVFLQWQNMSSIKDKVTTFCYLVQVLVLIRGILYAKEYEELRATIKSYKSHEEYGGDKQ